MGFGTESGDVMEGRSEGLGRTDTHTLFGERGLRCTRQRVEVFEALMASCEHPTAEELHKIVNERPPLSGGECCEDEGEESGEGRVSLATVYNTLDALCRVGLARRLVCACGGARYDADLREHLHVTTEDGKVLDVPEDLGGRVLERIPAEALREVGERLGVKIRRVRVEFEGERVGGCSGE